MVFDTFSLAFNNLKPFRFDDLQYQYTESYIEVGEKVKTAYIDTKRGAETLVFIHGLGSYLPAWYPQIEGLRRHYRCIALDLPGYGKSAKGNFQIGMAWYASIVAQLIQILDLHHVHVVGHSMGGQIALHLTHRFPELVDRLILLAPAGFEQFNPIEARWCSTAATAYAVKRYTAEEIRKNLASNFFHFPKEAQFMVRDRLAMRAAPDYAQYCQSVAQSIVSMVREPVFDFLPQIEHSTLIFYGYNDRLIPNPVLHPTLSTLQVAKAGSQALPNSQLIMLYNCGHFVPYERPETVNEQIRLFLQTPPPSGHRFSEL
jgi:pimeloyl-ACP methyl ester carboxylesterase